jgi:hypothetical protein
MAAPVKSIAVKEKRFSETHHHGLGEKRPAAM